MIVPSSGRWKSFAGHGWGRPGYPLAGRAAAAEGSQPATIAARPSSKAPQPTRRPPKVWIDFDHIADRIHRVAIPDMIEGQLWWSPDSKKLAFTAAPEGKSGVYTIAPPSSLVPELLTRRTGKSARWLATDNRIVWLSSGIPGSVTPGPPPAAQGKDEVLYRFSVPQEFNVSQRYAAAFNLCWRTLRDYFYDPRMNNRNWDAIRRKYMPMAEAATSGDELAVVVDMMLGELNSSHIRFNVAEGDSQASDSQRPGVAPAEHPWIMTTATPRPALRPELPGVRLQSA